jgi:hypothetical protein
MGFFSFITSDTNVSIPNIHSGKPIFPVYMATQDGQVFVETEYDGYGKFGGKDIYELIADLNNLCPNGTCEDKRMEAINLLFKAVITNGKKSYTKGVDFRKWTDVMKDENLSPNELIHDAGWYIDYPNGNGEFDKAAKNGIILPKLFEDRASINRWEEFPYPTSCSDQGYFYNDFQDEEDEDNSDITSGSN